MVRARVWSAGVQWSVTNEQLSELVPEEMRELVGRSNISPAERHSLLTRDDPQGQLAT